jgi:hypothetical protein
VPRAFRRPPKTGKMEEAASDKLHILKPRSDSTLEGLTNPWQRILQVLKNSSVIACKNFQ